jgi:hypothetical protein
MNNEMRLISSFQFQSDNPSPTVMTWTRLWYQELSHFTSIGRSKESGTPTHVLELTYVTRYDSSIPCTCVLILGALINSSHIKMLLFACLLSTEPAADPAFGL